MNNYKRDWLPRLLEIERKSQLKEEILGTIALCVLWFGFIILIANV